MEQILTYTLPVVLILLAMAAILAVYYREMERRRRYALRKESQRIVSPIRLQAYERLALLLERTTPQHLLLDISVHELTVPQLQQQLLHTIRAEFDHNLSQQIYVSDELWEKIEIARNEMLTFVNAVALQLPPQSNTLTYAKTLIEAYEQNGTTPNDIALQSLKDEMQTII